MLVQPSTSPHPSLGLRHCTLRLREGSGCLLLKDGRADAWHTQLEYMTKQLEKRNRHVEAETDASTREEGVRCERGPKI